MKTIYPPSYHSQWLCGNSCTSVDDVLYIYINIYIYVYIYIISIYICIYIYSCHSHKSRKTSRPISNRSNFITSFEHAFSCSKAGIT